MRKDRKKRTICFVSFVPPRHHHSHLAEFHRRPRHFFFALADGQKNGCFPFHWTKKWHKISNGGQFSISLSRPACSTLANTGRSLVFTADAEEEDKGGEDAALTRRRIMLQRGRRQARTSCHWRNLTMHYISFFSTESQIRAAGLGGSELRRQHDGGAVRVHVSSIKRKCTIYRASPHANHSEMLSRKKKGKVPLRKRRKKLI